MGNKLEKLEQEAIMLEQLALLQHHLLWSSEQSPELYNLIVHSSCGQIAIKATSKIAHFPLLLVHAEDKNLLIFPLTSLVYIIINPLFYSIVLNEGYKYYNFNDLYRYQYETTSQNFIFPHFFFQKKFSHAFWILWLNEYSFTWGVSDLGSDLSNCPFLTIVFLLLTKCFCRGTVVMYLIESTATTVTVNNNKNYLQTKQETSRN